MAKSYDWDHWRRVYVIGDDTTTLDAIAKTPDAPALDTLKRRSMRESWPEQRRQYRHHSNTKAAEDDTTKGAIAKVEQLVDKAELITRHAKMARWLINLGGKAISDAEKISPHVALQMIKLGLEAERLSLGLETDYQVIEERIRIEAKAEARAEHELFFSEIMGDDEIPVDVQKKLLEHAIAIDKQQKAAVNN